MKKKKYYITRGTWDELKSLPNFHELLAAKGLTEDDYIVMEYVPVAKPSSLRKRGSRQGSVKGRRGTHPVSQ
jgi:ABC-type nitrate/sulfonate/bicarbonate transport system substrate-binding protein